MKQGLHSIADRGAVDWHGMQVIARGANRLCVMAPDGSGHCLKFELPVAERPNAGLRERFRRWLGRRFKHWGDNATELHAWGWLHQRHGDALVGRIAASHGLLQTPWGTSLQSDCVCLQDGTAAPSIHALLAKPGQYSADALCAAVDEFEAWLLHLRIPLHDLNAGNFVVVPRAAGLRLVCVDPKSTVSGKELVPLSRWIPRLMQRKIRRRAERLRKRIRAALPAETPLR